MLVAKYEENIHMEDFSADLSIMSIITAPHNGSATQRWPWPPHSWGFYVTHNNAQRSEGQL